MRALVAVGLLGLVVRVAHTVALGQVGFGVLRFRHPMEVSAVVLTAVAVDALVRRRPVAGPEPVVVGS